MQLEAHRIGWATRTMETAARHIEELEKIIVRISNPQPPEDDHES